MSDFSKRGRSPAAARRHSYAAFDAVDFDMQADKQIVPSRKRELYGMMLRSALVAAAIASICLFLLEPLWR